MEHLKIKLEIVQAQIDAAMIQLGNPTNSDKRMDALRDFIVVLGEEKRGLRANMEALTPTPTVHTPAPAPPGNSITLPQVLPLASFLSSPSSEFASSTNYN